MYGVEKKIEWLSDILGDYTLSLIMKMGLDFDTLFDIEDFDDFKEFILEHQKSPY